MDSITEDTQEAQEQDKSGTTPKRGKSPLKRLKDRIAQLDSLSRTKGLKAHTQAAVALEAASIERLLYNDSRADKNDETLAELATLKARREQDAAEIQRLTQANAELQSRATRTQVQPERIPDSVLQEQIQTLEALLQSVATLARVVDVDSRTRYAVSVTMKYGKRARSVVEGLGVDYASVSQTLQTGQAELLSRLEAAQQEGSGTIIWRAVLVERDGFTATIGKRRYRDEFSDEYADVL